MSEKTFTIARVREAVAIVRRCLACGLALLALTVYAQQDTVRLLDYEQQGLDYHRRFAQRIATGYASGVIADRSAAEYLQQEKVSLTAGTFETLLQLSTDNTASMQLALAGGKRYLLGFAKGNMLAMIAYPADYQLIMGVSLMEMEQHLAENVRQTPLPRTVQQATSDSSQLVRLEGSDLYLRKGPSYIIDELNANRYYVYDRTHGEFSLLLSADYPSETMANLVTGTDIDAGINLEILLVKYGFQTETFTVPLRQWVAFCLKEGCTPYFGVISHEQHKTVCELVMHNEALGYAHVMKLIIDPAIIDSRKGKATARLNSYVPLSNVKSVFYDNQ